MHARVRVLLAFFPSAFVFLHDNLCLRCYYYCSANRYNASEAIIVNFVFNTLEYFVFLQPLLFNAMINGGYLLEYVISFDIIRMFVVVVVYFLFINLLDSLLLFNLYKGLIINNAIV